jgi:hypothetical protein
VTSDDGRLTPDQVAGEEALVASLGCHALTPLIDLFPALILLGWDGMSDPLEPVTCEAPATQLLLWEGAT